MVGLSGPAVRPTNPDGVSSDLPMWRAGVLLPDGETIHNAFFDRRFTP